jgi:hypothetical protein
LVIDLEFFKIRKQPIAPYVISRVKEIHALLKSGIMYPSLSEEMKLKLQVEQVSVDHFTDIFVDAFKIALQKFEKHILNHSALPLFEAIQCFDPRYIHSQIERTNILLYSIIPEFKIPNLNLIQEWGIYSNLNEIINSEKDFDLENYWIEKKNILPTLANIALIYIWLPVSGVDVERSFSIYKNILSDRRYQLSKESIIMLSLIVKINRI